MTTDNTDPMVQRCPDFQRLVTALRRQESDYVPFAELLVEEDVKAARAT